MTPQQQKQAKLKADLANTEGEIVYEIFTDVNPEFRIRPNVDFDVNEMTPEQREIYDAFNEINDDAYEELEDDFVMIANEGVMPMRKKEEIVKDIIKATEVDDVKGDQIEVQSFMDIIRKDAELLGIKDDNKDVIEDDYESSDDQCDEDEEQIRETKEGLSTDGNNDEEIPKDILELMILNKAVKKGMEVVEQRVETVAGGGKLIFRKVKKIKKPENESQIEEKEDPENIGEDKLDELSFEVDSDGEGVTKSELDKLEANYQRLKALKKQKNTDENDSQLSQSEYEDEETEIEIIKIDGEELIKYSKSNKHVKKTKYNIKEDLALKHAIENDSDDESYNIERPLMRKLNIEVCPLAPEDRVKPQNYYCMAVVKEDLDVNRNIISL